MEKITNLFRNILTTIVLILSVAATGDYNGDGRMDAAIFRPSNSTWFVQRSTAGTLIQAFGIAGDLPVPNVFVP